MFFEGELRMLISLISWFFFGLIVGAIARLLMPGPQPMGIFATMLLGVAGSYLGGFVAFLLVGGSILQATSWLGSILGAIAVLMIASYQRRPKATPMS